jgi:hypothetical protein
VSAHLNWRLMFWLAAAWAYWLFCTGSYRAHRARHHCHIYVCCGRSRISG